MHPNVLKMFVMIIAILALGWILLLTGIIRFTWVRFFLLVIFTTVISLSLLTEPKQPQDSSYCVVSQGP